VRDEVGPHRLEHQALRGRYLAQARELVTRQRAQVRVRQDAALERALAAPGHIGHEVAEAERRQALPHARVMRGVVPSQHEQLLHPPARGAVEQALDLVRLVQVRAVGGERAVLAVRHARARERKGQVSGECDAARGHAISSYRTALGCPAQPLKANGK
jgi:hypothetical protein